MKILQITVVVIALVGFFSPRSAEATAISLGTGGYWLRECSGQSTERLPSEAKNRCELMLFSYVMGVVAQAQLSGVKPIYCDTPRGELSEQLVAYLNSHTSELKEEFLDVLHRFFDQNCKMKSTKDITDQSTENRQ